MDLALYYWIIIFIFVGFSSGLLGIGGGVILMPILLAVGIDIKNAVSISVVQMISSSSFGTFLNYRSANLKIRDSLFLGLGGSLGAVFGIYVLNVLPSIVLQFSLLVILSFAIMQSLRPIRKIKNLDIQINEKIIFIIGIISGSISIPLGIGGAIVIIAFFSLLGMDAKKISSISLFFVIFTSISAFFTIFLSNNELVVEYDFIILIVLSTMFGSFLGIYAKNKIDIKYYKKFFLPLYLSSLTMTLYSIFLKLL